MSASAFDASAAARAWRPPPLIAAPALRYAVYLIALAYAVLSVGSIDVNWTRAAEGVERAGRFLGGLGMSAFGRPGSVGSPVKISRKLFACWTVWA